MEELRAAVDVDTCLPLKDEVQLVNPLVDVKQLTRVVRHALLNDMERGGVEERPPWQTCRQANSGAFAFEIISLRDRQYAVAGWFAHPGEGVRGLPRRDKIQFHSHWSATAAGSAHGDTARLRGCSGVLGAFPAYDFVQQGREFAERARNPP